MRRSTLMVSINSLVPAIGAILLAVPFIAGALRKCARDPNQGARRPVPAPRA
jgi:hypothetical protein